MMFHDVDFCVIAVERGLVIEAEVPNPAVSKELMKEIMKWRQEGCTMDDTGDLIPGSSGHTLLSSLSSNLFDV